MVDAGDLFFAGAASFNLPEVELAPTDFPAAGNGGIRKT